MAEVQALAAVIRVARVEVCGKHGKKVSALRLRLASESAHRIHRSHN